MTFYGPLYNALAIQIQYGPFYIQTNIARTTIELSWEHSLQAFSTPRPVIFQTVSGGFGMAVGGFMSLSLQ